MTQIPDRRTHVLQATLVLALGAAGSFVLDDVARAVDPPSLQVALDEELEIRFRNRVLPRRVDADTIRIRTADGRQARGETLLGRFLIDDATQRRAVVNPDAVREHHQLVLGMDRETATRKADRLLRSIERSGRLRKLHEIDRGLRAALGASYRAGTRLDASQVDAFYPPPVSGTDELAPYRRLVAGDDDLWRAHLDGDSDAFDRLRHDAQSERFLHPVDPKTGVAAAESVLRTREHRRVLIRRNRRTVQFLPDVPTRAALEDAGFEPDTTYTLEVRGPLRGARTVLTGRRSRARYRRHGVLLTTPSRHPFLAGVDELVGSIRQGVPPRIVNVTPPDGETRIDPTTDWEDPDDRYLVPEPARRPFTARVRFAQPLDPRSVGLPTFHLHKVAVEIGTPQEADVYEYVEAGVFLAQTRLGEVRVDVTPAHDLDPRSRYRLTVTGSVQGLSGEFLGVDFATAFETD